MLPPLSHVTFTDKGVEPVTMKLQFKFEEAFAGLGVIFISVTIGTGVDCIVTLLEHKVVPSSKPSFGVMHACQISLTFILLELILLLLL